MKDHHLDQPRHLNSSRAVSQTTRYEGIREVKSIQWFVMMYMYIDACMDAERKNVLFEINFFIVGKGNKAAKLSEKRPGPQS